ncbi:MAG: ATP-binding protein [Candidatus Margulisiibacteriota bacterium]
MINRQLEALIDEKLFKGKAIVIIGPRQVGKTTLLKDICRKVNKNVLWLDGDEPDVRQQYSHVTSTALKQKLAPFDVVIIDEAQRISNVGLTIKLIIDNIPDIQVIVSGSSALELTQQVNEPLTGRKFEYSMFPISYKEHVDHFGTMETSRLLESRLIFGMYPDVINHPGEEQEVLRNLASSYLYKDLFQMQDIRKPEQIERLLLALALQVGSQVSYHELSKTLGIDLGTIQRYIHLLELAYIVFRLPSFSRNLRTELKKSRKIYFYDNGIRNAIIANYAPLKLRNDVGFLWENFLVSERVKFNSYEKYDAKLYFWRTQQQKEIDLIEDYNGNLSAYEFKYSNKFVNKIKAPLSFVSSYPDAIFNVISPDNVDSFILKHA